MQKLLFAIIALVVVLGGIALFNNQTKNSQGGQQPTPTTATQSVQATPSSTTTPSDTMMEKEKKVNLTSSGFNPQTLTVKAGTKVTWVNKSGQMATVNSDVHPTHLLYPFLNLGSFADGASLSVVFQNSGTYTYHNHLNPSDTGTVVVQ